MATAIENHDHHEEFDSPLTLLRGGGDAALCSPAARASRVRDHPGLTGRGGQTAWRLGSDGATSPLLTQVGSPSNGCDWSSR